jgi:hypothetical protein
LEELSDSELGEFPFAYANITDGKIITTIPENYQEKLKKYKSRYRKLVNNYPNRLINTLKAIHTHFT